MSENKIIIQIKANQSLFFIISGRRKGAKLPVRKTSDGFELFPELQEWKVAVGFGGPDFLLARSISQKGIKGIPIVSIVLGRVRNKIIELITQRFAASVLQSATNEIRTSLRGI